MTAPIAPRHKEGAKTGEVRNMIAQITLTLLLPVVGWFASRVMDNSENIAVLIERLGSHASRDVHPGAAAMIDRAVKAIEKQQALRDVGLRRELEQIQRTLQELKAKAP